MTLAIGGHTIHELLSKMDAEEYAYWRAFDFIHPIMDLHGEDRREAMALALQMNINRKKGTAAIKSEKLMLRPTLPTMRRQPTSMIKSAFMALVNRGKGIKKHKKKEKR